MNRSKLLSSKQKGANPQTDTANHPMSNVFKRILLGGVMLPTFVALCISDKKYMVIFVIGLAMAINYEIISIAKRHNRLFALNKALIFYFAVLLYSDKALPGIVAAFPHLSTMKLLHKIKGYYFTLYTTGLMVCILCLKKGKLSSQLLQLTVTLTSSYTMGVTCQFAIRNIVRGPFYFFYPAILVIANDIFAYAVGKLFGRTQLYSLSPNKTWEGFIGASFFTFITGFILSYLKIKQGFLPDDTNRYLNTPVNKNISYLDFPVIYSHNIAFSFGASFVAPFFGFLASAIKRAFKKKDFGYVIPGHGGITDRMDCQILMVFFTYFYSQAFIRQNPESIPHLCEYISSVYSKQEISEIIKRISDLVQ